MAKIILTENQLVNLIKNTISKLTGDSSKKDDLKLGDVIKNIGGEVKKKFEDLFGDTDDDMSKKSVDDFFGKVKGGEFTDIDVKEPTMSDDQFYKKILQKIDAPTCPENMKFLYAWRQSEGGKSSYNPFNTTHKKERSSFYNCLKRKNGKCVAGVRNYKSEEDGIDATVKTLTNGYYPCIVDGLKKCKGAKKIANSCTSNLKTWGTGELISKVLDGKKLNPPDIASSPGKTVS
jgi:hypothetical protein